MHRVCLCKYKIAYVKNLVARTHSYIHKYIKHIMHTVLCILYEEYD